LTYYLLCFQYFLFISAFPVSAANSTVNTTNSTDPYAWSDAADHRYGICAYTCISKNMVDFWAASDREDFKQIGLDYNFTENN
jgi:hypothetical protein